MRRGANELAFLVTGIYGKPLPNAVRRAAAAAVPWKYGFKSVKSIVQASASPTSGRRPSGRRCRPSEYGFWANVNPEVPHPRWSQASEHVLGTRERKPTLLFNGYGEQVAGLYKGLEKESLFM